MTSMERIKQNADLAKNTIQELKSELKTLTAEFNTLLAQQLRDENAKLLAAVETAKHHLVQAEIQNGVPQIPVPSNKTQTPAPPQPVPEQAEPQHDPKPNENKEAKPKKEAKKKQPAKEAKEAPPEAPVDVGRLDLRVAKVEDVQRHPDADSLYVLKINCGEEKPRTVCSGLVKHVPIEELRERMVMLLCNLKPVKMRGITSEAMVMCASSESGVEVLNVPEGCAPGDHVHCEGYTRQPDTVMNPKKKIFETVAPDLHTDALLQACYKGVPLTIPGKGVVLAKSMKNVPVK